jgi:hypothetical protein
MSDTERIKTLEPREKPTAQQLIDELLESIRAMGAMGVFERLLRCHKTAECQWAGQQPDGRRGEADSELPVFRWKGSPDLKIPLAAKLIRWLTMLRMSVFNRGDARIGPRRAPAMDGAGADGQNGGTDLAATWQYTMEYFRCVGDYSLAKCYELFSTCVEEFGYALILGDWLKKQRMELATVTIQQLTDALIEAQREQLIAQALEADPQIDAEAFLAEKDGEIVQLVQQQLEELTAPGAEISELHVELVQGVDARMSDGEARKVIQALRANPGQAAEYHAPRDDGGVFEAEALVPGVNCLHSYDMTGDGKADFVAVPRYWSEAKINERARAEKWNKKATEKLIKDCKNKLFDELGAQGFEGVPEWALNGVGIGCVPNKQAMEKIPRWLVVYVYRKVTTKAGLPMVYKAVVNPHMPKDLLLWKATDMEELPILCETSEPVVYAMMAKGVPDVILDKQNFVKDTLDSEGARGQLGSNPPLLRTAGQNVGLRPGIELYARKSGTSFEGSKFMDVPVVDQGSLKVVEMVERLVEEYYFRGQTTDEADKQLFVEHMTFRSIRCYRELLRLMWRQIQENIETLQVSRINDREVNLEANRDQLKGEADITIGVHLDGYSQGSAEKFMTVMEKLVSMDRGGVIDSNEAVNTAAQLMIPTYARRLITSSEAADGKTVDDQETRIAKMAAGVPMQYAERVENPPLRMQVLQQWAQMPGNIERAQLDPNFAALLEKEQQWLTVQDQQQNENPLIGRTGVKPN